VENGAFDKDENLRIYNKSFSVVPKRIIIPLKKYNLAHERVLDVGCAYGDYLRFFGEGSLGVDIVSKSITFARSIGLNAKLCNIEGDNFDLPENYFDAAWVSNILEHVESPRKCLQNIRFTLKKDGLIFVKIPLIPSQLFAFVYKVLTRNSRLGYTASDHTYAFSLKTADIQNPFMGKVIFFKGNDNPFGNYTKRLIVNP